MADSVNDDFRRSRSIKDDVGVRIKNEATVIKPVCRLPATGLLDYGGKRNVKPIEDVRRALR